MTSTGVAALLLGGLPCYLASPGKSTISASDAMHAVQFNLKYLPVTMAEDNGVGDEGRGAIQGRVQVLQTGSYTEKNCQLYSSKGQLSSASKYQSMVQNGLGKACTNHDGKKYTSGTELHMVFAYNDVQCCNACVATDGCVGATFLTSDNDHSGGQGPQSWEGFGMHITDVTTAKTTGGIAESQLQQHFRDRFGDFSAFDQFMDYSVTFFTYDLQPYIDAFKADGVSFFTAQWEEEQTKDTWYSMIFQVQASHYVVELTSTLKPNVDSNLPQIEQRMSPAHCEKFRSEQKQPANLLLISSINRAASDMSAIDHAYTSLFKGTTTHHIQQQGLERRCYSFLSGLTAGPTALDEDVCFTSRTSNADKDTIYSVVAFEEMLWAEHAGTIGNNPDSMIDKYTDNHYALPMPSAGLSALSSYFESNDPYPITKDTRLAYACEQSYIIDPTGWSIQPLGMAMWPKCSYASSIAV